VLSFAPRTLAFSSWTEADVRSLSHGRLCESLVVNNDDDDVQVDTEGLELLISRTVARAQQRLRLKLLTSGTTDSIRVTVTTMLFVLERCRVGARAASIGKGSHPRAS